MTPLFDLPHKILAAVLAAGLIFTLGLSLVSAHRTIGKLRADLRTAEQQIDLRDEAIRARDRRLAAFAATERTHAEANAIQCSDSVTQAFNRGVAAGRAVCEARR